MEIYIRTPLLRLPIRTVHGCGLEDANRDLATLDGAFLLSDAVHVRACGTAVGDLVPRWVGAEVFNGHLVRVEAAGIVSVVVVDINRIEAGEKLLGDAVQERLVQDSWLQVVESLVSGL